MPDIKELKARIGADLTKFDAGLKEMNSKLKTAQDDVKSKYGAIDEAVGRVGMGLTLGVTLPLALIAKQSIDAGSAALETQNKFDVAFESMGKSATQSLEAFSKAAGGLNMTDLKDRAAAFELIFGNMAGIAKISASSMSTDLAKLTYDLSSLYNVDMEEAQQRLFSGLMGETEAVRRFGMDLSDARLKEDLHKKGIDANTQSMTQAQKVQERYRMIMEQSTKALGDRIRTQDSTENKERQFQDQLKTTEEGISKTLLPAYTKLLGFGVELLQFWDKQSEGMKSAEIYAAMVAATLGPMAVGVGKLWGAWKTYGLIKSGVAIQEKILAGATLETAGATGVATVATNAEVTALERKAIVGDAMLLWNSSYAASEIAVAGAVNTSTLALMRSKVAMLGIGGAATLAAVGVGALLYSVDYWKDRVGKEAKDAVNTDAKTDKAFVDKRAERLAKMSKDALRYRSADLTHEIGELEKKKAEADKSAGWHWPGTTKEALTFLPDLVAKGDSERLTDQIKRKKAELDQVSKAQENLAQGAASTGPAELSKEAKKVLADNEEANTVAKRNLWVLQGSTEIDRQERQAWVDLKAEKEKILAKVEDAKKTTGQVLDVTPQLTLLETKYKAELTKLASTRKEAVLDEQAAGVVAKIHLAALKTTDEWEAQKLEVVAETTARLRELQKNKAKQVEIELAIAEADKQVRDIAKRQAEEQTRNAYGDYFAKEEAGAIGKGDEFGVRRVGILKEFTEAYGRALMDQASGKPATGAIARAWAVLRKDIADVNKAEANKILDGQKAVAQATLDVTVRQAEGRGDQRTADLTRLKGEAVIAAVDLGRAMQNATREDEKQVIAQKQKLLGVDTEIKRFDILTGGAQAFRDKAKQWKEEEVRGWHERMEAAKRYVDHLRDSVQFMTGEQMWEQATVAGARTAFQMPYVEPRPSELITPEDTARYWDRQSQENAAQITNLQEIASTLRGLLIGGAK